MFFSMRAKVILNHSNLPKCPSMNCLTHPSIFLIASLSSYLIPVSVVAQDVLPSVRLPLAPLDSLSETEPFPSSEGRVVAQVVEPTVRPPAEPVPGVETLPPLEDLFPPLELPTNGLPQPQLDIPGTIVVQQFTVVGSTVLSQSELTEVLDVFTNRPITFAELIQAQEALTKLYIERGYVTTGAFIPPQSLKDGIVQIEVVEGTVEDIEVRGLTRLRSNYVKSRLRRGVKAPLNQGALLEALQLLQLDPLIDRLSADLRAGSRPGANVLTVEVTEAPAFEARVAIDNDRVPSVGSNRRSIDLAHSNVTGYGDRLNISYFNTNGSNALDNLSYRFPINASNGTLGISYRRIGSNVIEEPFDELDLESNFEQYTLTYRQPIIQTPRQDVALGLTVDRQLSNVNLLDNLIEGETRILALRFFQEYTQRSSRDVFAARSQFTAGLEGFETALSGDQTDEGFFVWRGQAQYFRAFTPQTNLLLRADLQLADRSLIPIEQFSLGGVSTVRGYRQDLLLSDNGFFASAELRQTILRIRALNATLQIAPFFDVGTTWNFAETASSLPATLASTGVGLRLNVADNLNARLDIGFPLVDVDIDRDTLQENGIHFLIEYRLRL